VDFAAYDLFVLRRPRVQQCYSEAQIADAEARFKQLSEADFSRIERILIAGLPASERKFDRSGFLKALLEYEGISGDDLRANLASFLN